MQSVTKSAKQTFQPNCSHISAICMVFSMDTDSISLEENNLLRLIYVIKKPCTECLRHVLKNNVPSSYTDIKNAVSSSQNQLQRILTRKQNSSLFPQNQLCSNFSVDICDMSLLYTLIRNVSSVQPPTTGWDQPVSNQPRDSSIGANVERLRVLRNDILHEEKSEIPDLDFSNYWSDIRASLADIDQCFGNTTYQQRLESLRTVDLDTRFVQKEITKIRCRRALQRIEERVEHVENTTTRNMITLNEIHHHLLGNAESVEHVKNTTTKNMITLNEIHHCLLENAVRTDKVIDPQEVTGLGSIQGLSLEDLENTDKSNQQCVNERKNDEASSTDSTNIRNENQNEADNRAASKDALDCDMTRENEISIAEGQDVVICLTKQYSYIKSNLTKRNVDAIAKCLLEKGLLSVDEHETITVTNLPRRHHVDHLLKKVILRGSDQLKAFIKVLKTVNIKIAKTLDGTKVTDQDRSRFQQVEECALRNVNASARLDSKCNLDDNDIHFFQVYLSAFPEDVESINDTMLALFHFSVHDHSNVQECRKLDKKIKKLCETMQLCDMNVENELKSLLDDSLYIKWIELRKNRGMHDRSWYLRWLRWLNARVALAGFFLRPFGIVFNQAETGSIILKFLAGDDFDMASLTPQLVRENMTDLLWKGHLETQFKITNPVHVTVFIMSPSGNGHDEIHFYLDFDAPDITTRREDYKQDIVVQERKFLLEELDPAELSEWITNQPDAEKTTKQMFEDKCSRSDMSRKEEMDVLLDIIYAFKNGRELMKRFCKENDHYVYNKLFLKTDQHSTEEYESGGNLQQLYSIWRKINTEQKTNQHSTEEHESLKQKPLQYERGGGLQRLYSFWMNINTEQGDIIKLQETDEFQRATRDEGPLKPPQNLVSNIKQLQEMKVFQRATLDGGPSKSPQNLEVSYKKILHEIEEFQRMTLGEGPSKPPQNLEVLYKKILDEIKEFQGMNLGEGPSKPPQNLEVLYKQILHEIEEFQRTTLGEGPSKSPQNLDVSYIKQLQEIKEFLRTTLVEGPSKPPENLEVSLRKYGSTTVVIQVGKLEEIWSDAMIILGKPGSKHLPTQIIKMVGPQIQREFEDKYPHGLSHNNVAVLSGFNLPVWRILYCETSVGYENKECKILQSCLQQAGKLMMHSILFLVQEEDLAGNLRDLSFALRCMHDSHCGTLTFYFLIDQDNIKWRTIRKITEDKLPEGSESFYRDPVADIHTDATKPSANLEPKVFSVGHTTVIIQVGKLEKIQSDALVIFEVSKGQWPKLDLPSEILEKAGPMIQREFEEKFPAGLEYAEVAVLNGYNLPFKKILYGVLPRWPVAWLTQVITKFATECLQLASEEKIQSIAFMIPSLAYHVAVTFAHVLYCSVHMPVHDKLSLSISMLNIVIKDGCAGGSTLRKVFEEEWAHRIEFKEGHVTVVNQDRLWEEILMKRREESQTEAILSEQPQEKAKISDSEALVILSRLDDIADILETMVPSPKKELRNKNPSDPQKEEVTVLDGYNNPFKKIYCSKDIHRSKVTDNLLECFNMAEKDKINSIILLTSNYIDSAELVLDVIFSLRIFIIENPSSSIRKLYMNSQSFRKEIYDDVGIGKVFKERHVTVVIKSIHYYSTFESLGILDTGASHKKNYVYVICGVTDIKQFKGGHHQSPEAETLLVLNHYKFLPDLEEARTSMIEHFQKGLKSAEVSLFESKRFGAKTIFFGTPELDRQDMDLFFYECLQKADGMGVSSIIFLVPDFDSFVWDYRLFARTLSSCVKRFAKNTPFSSIKRIYICIARFNLWLQETAQVLEEEFAKKSGEDKAEDFSPIVDEPQKKRQEGKQGYPSADIYLKQTVTSPLPAKSKEGSKYFPKEEVD